MSGSSTPDQPPLWEGRRQPPRAAAPNQPPADMPPPGQMPPQPMPQPGQYAPPPQGYAQPGQYAPPPGYPPQGYPQQGYPQQGYPPGYGYPMYAQPPKPNSTKIVLIVVGCVVGAMFLVSFVFALAAIPLISANTNEAKSSEARAALGTIKDRLRVKYIQNNNRVDPRWRLSDLVRPDDLEGKYYGADDYSIVGTMREDMVVLRAAANVQTAAPQVTLTMTNVATGRAIVTSP